MGGAHVATLKHMCAIFPTKCVCKTDVLVYLHVHDHANHSTREAELEMRADQIAEQHV
jgi:hypothetical protein